MTIQPGTDIGRYHILEQLGEGGMAVVYKAYDTQLEREVALKVIRTENILPNALDRALKRFQIEARKMAGLSHPNIVKIMDFGEYKHTPYLVMEYIPGGTLKQKLGQPIPWHEAIQVLKPIAEALAYAHRKGLIHRDVKPSNILIDEDGRPILTDFGIAKVLEGEETLDLTTTGMGIGTPEYMSPEQAEGKKVDARSDIYSLGIVLYELVTGRKPYIADTPMAVIVKQIRDPLPRPSQYVPDLSVGVERVLFKVLAKDPHERYTNTDDFIQALEYLSANAGKSSQENRIITEFEKKPLTPIIQVESKLDETRLPEEPKGIPKWVWGVAGLGLAALLLFVFSLGGSVSFTKVLPTAPTAPPNVFKAAMLTDLGGLAASKEVKGFSDLGWDALQKAKTDLGIEITLLEAKELADLEPNLTKMGSEGYDFVVGVGFLFTDAMTAVAPKFPNTKFAIVDSVVDAPNVASLVFAEEEGSFLVGALAAGMSKSGTIGFLGGMEIPLIVKFEAGYIAGAKSINPNIKVLSGYTGNFTDDAKGKEISLTQFTQGADVIYAVAGMCNFGTIEAAKEKGFYTIGVDSNQDAVAKGSVLTSMLKHVEVAVYNSVKTAFDGTFKGGIVVNDLKSGGVGYSDMQYTKDKVPAELLAKVVKLSDMVKSGAITVPTTMEELATFMPPTL